jgi:hypothetical protein
MATRVPFALPLAIVLALFDLVPMVGATLGSIIVALAALLVSRQLSATAVPGRRRRCGHRRRTGGALVGVTSDGDTRSTQPRGSWSRPPWRQSPPGSC